jgi:hypothetical protein
MNKVELSVNKKNKLKMKKNADEFVDIKIERQLDPKYKTELCKSWLKTNLCVYGNKCRFAHGSSELFSKYESTTRYKQKNCKSFEDNGFCMYGSRCNFRHSEIKLNDIERSYYNYMLSVYKSEVAGKNELQHSNNIDHLGKYCWKNNSPASCIHLNTICNQQIISKEKVKNVRRLSVFEQITRKSDSLSENSTDNNSEDEIEGVSDELSNKSFNCDVNQNFRIINSNRWTRYSFNQCHSGHSNLIRNSLPLF